jgi:hypothetical protein
MQHTHLLILVLVIVTAACRPSTEQKKYPDRESARRSVEDYVTNFTLPGQSGMLADFKILSPNKDAATSTSSLTDYDPVFYSAQMKGLPTWGHFILKKPDPAGWSMTLFAVRDPAFSPSIELQTSAIQRVHLGASGERLRVVRSARETLFDGEYKKHMEVEQFLLATDSRDEPTTPTYFLVRHNWFSKTILQANPKLIPEADEWIVTRDGVTSNTEFSAY